MVTLPIYVSLLFILTTVLTICFFYKALTQSKKALYLILAWLIAQGVISFAGFYTVTNTVPPRFLLLIGPALFLIIFLFFSARGKAFINSLDEKSLTLLHIVRIPVELVLYFLFIHKTVPVLLTFEGRNFDIISGISAPFIFYFGYVKKKLSKKIIIAWNIICLVLLINVVMHGVLSAPTPFQKFAFDQPNIALFHFPFSWLPCFIVPMVLFSHLVCLRKLLLKK